MSTHSVTIHQPNFNPYLGVMAKYLLADVIIHLDTVQFVRSEFENRNRICYAGQARWLTVPIQHHHGQLIRDVKLVNNTPWRYKQIETLRQTYSKESCFKSFYPLLEDCYQQPAETLVEWNLRVLQTLFKWLGVEKETHLASEMKTVANDRDERLINLVQEVGGDVYLAGGNGLKYMGRDTWESTPIQTIFCQYEHPVYGQGSFPFVPYCGLFDLLFRVTPQEALTIILSGVHLVDWNGNLIEG
jgi:hypothetical protein